MAHLQAVAAIGQSVLVEAYERCLAVHGHHAAQVLLTADDLDHRTRYLNARNTLLTLLELGAVPIINENDTVAVEELQTTFGDNDRLAAMVTNLIQAPLLVLLSDVDGLYDGDPRQPGSKLIPTVSRLDPAVFGLVRDKASGLSKGGMASKLKAARICTTAGENVIIAKGRSPDVLPQIIAGEPVGTLFLGPRAELGGPQAVDRLHRPAARPAGARRRGPAGRGTQGPEPAGRRRRRGRRPVRQRRRGGRGGPAGDEFARGLTNYTSDEIERIKGLKSRQIAEILGQCPYEEVIHRDNMVVLSNADCRT